MQMRLVARTRPAREAHPPRRTCALGSRTARPVLVHRGPRPKGGASSSGSGQARKRGGRLYVGGGRLEDFALDPRCEVPLEGPASSSPDLVVIPTGTSFDVRPGETVIAVCGSRSLDARPSARAPRSAPSRRAVSCGAGVRAHGVGCAERTSTIPSSSLLRAVSTRLRSSHPSRRQLREGIRAQAALRARASP